MKKPFIVFALIPTIAFATVKINKEDTVEKTKPVITSGIPTPTVENVYKSPTVKPVPQYEYFAFLHDSACLTEAIYFEARGESKKGKLRVLDSILNRTAYKNNWGSTVCETINENRQYSYKHEEYEYNFENPIDRKAYIDIKKLVSKTYGDYLNGKYKPSKVYYYYNPHEVKSTPSWVDEKYYLFTIGKHKFYSWHKNA